MRYIKLIGVVLLSAILSVSCSRMLEENPESYISEHQFFQTKEDADASVLSIYSYLTNNHSRNMYILTATTTDEGGVSPGGADPLKDYTFDANHGTISEFWQNHYRVITRANVSLAGIPTIDMDETLKNSLLAEARFLRAVAYFRMVQFFGKVPLVLVPIKSAENTNIHRSSVDSIYNQIIEDLTFAESHLPKYNNTVEGRPSVPAATGMLTKVYLTRGNWDKAVEKAEAFFSNHKDFQLMDKFSDVFTPETQPNKENIWVLNFKAGLPGDQQFELKYYLPRDLPGARGLSRYLPTAAIYNSYQTGDLRKDWTFFTSYTTGGRTYTFPPHWHKFMDYRTLSNTDDNDTDVPLIRFADMLLMYAEALNEKSGPVTAAYDAVNAVRRRAYGIKVPSPAVDLQPALSKDDFRKAVWQERKWEFAGEWHRWFDLKRTGRLLSTVAQFVGKEVDSRYDLFPVPQREMDINTSLKPQNPGY